MELQDLKAYAETALMESLDLAGFMSADDIISEIERAEPDFDGDSYCPYYNQQDEVISRYESDFGQEAEDIAGEQTYKASEYQQALTAYAYAIAYIGFSQYLAEAKDELKQAVADFANDAALHLVLDEEPMIQVSSSCIHGWASHNRETADGLMIWESGQLDGCNGAAIKTDSGLWLSCCIERKAA
jgi:hypothetical protein